MKKLLAALVIVGFFAVPAFAGPTLVWDFTPVSYTHLTLPTN